MILQFHEDVRKALAGAREEALRLAHDYVGTEHLLLGLLRDPDSRVRALLREFGVAGEVVREQLERVVRRGRDVVNPVGKLPYTSRAKRALEFAMREASSDGRSEATAEHLLLGLMLEQKGIAAQVLSLLGVDFERTREAMAREAGLAPQRAPTFRMDLDDRSDRSIYEQIIARVQESVATGDLTPGARLPAVRQLADQLDIAPGTVARAYSELERLGVVVTDGARGTRIAEPSAATRARSADIEQIAGLLRPAAVAGFHMGADAQDMRRALEAAMKGIFAE